MPEAGATTNTNSVVNQGEFHPSMATSKHDTKGHKVGVLKGNEAVPEFNAQQLPAGSAPSDRTFKPNPNDDVPQTTKHNGGGEADSGSAAASDTIGGATSAQVHTGLGKPMGGQSSSELHDNSKSGSGLESTGATTTGAKTVDARDPNHADQRALGKDDAQLKNELGGPPAQDRI